MIAARAPSRGFRRQLPLPCRAYIVPVAPDRGGDRPATRPSVPKPDPSDVPSNGEARDRLRETGLRATAARIALVRAMAAAGGPLSHGEVCDRLRPDDADRGADARRFDQSTIYRGLTDLSDAGLLARVDLGDAVRRYEWLPADGADPVHPHHVCTGCGRIVCLEGFALQLTPASGPDRDAVGSIGEVVLRGLCGACVDNGNG